MKIVLIRRDCSEWAGVTGSFPLGFGDRELRPFTCMQNVMSHLAFTRVGISAFLMHHNSV